MSAPPCPWCGNAAAPVRGRCPQCGQVREPADAAPLIPQPVAAVLALGLLVALVVLAVAGQVMIAGIALVVLLLLVLALFGGGLW
ncbi:MAG TPA: hypothetical protein VGJ32_15000 [Solirubrobacteraceae bacterium]|jgi:hypothetical protein